MPVKLIINGIPLLGEQSGVGKYTHEIVARLAQHEDVFRTTYYYGYFSRNFPRMADEGTDDSLVSRLKHAISAFPLLKKVCRKASHYVSPLLSGQHNLYFEPNFALQPGIRANATVVTVHDFSCFLHPEWHPAERVAYMERHMWPSLERADRIVTVSEAMRREAVERFGLPASRVTTILNGVDHQRYTPPVPDAVRLLRQSWKLPEHFILFVGNLEPRKNLKHVLLTYAMLPQAIQRQFPLLLAGCSGWNNAELHAMLESMPHVRRLGFVPEKDLPTLYGAAEFLVYPSWYEGFGLPVLEAMACGCPVLASNDAALAEVGGDAVVCVSPRDVDGMRNAMLELLDDSALRERLHQAGLLRAAQFSWDESADKHKELFQSLCNA